MSQTWGWGAGGERGAGGARGAGAAGRKKEAHGPVIKSTEDERGNTATPRGKAKEQVAGKQRGGCQKWGGVVSRSTTTTDANQVGPAGERQASHGRDLIKESSVVCGREANNAPALAQVNGNRNRT
jgi:hypothetical protein